MLDGQQEKFYYLVMASNMWIKADYTLLPLMYVRSKGAIII